MPIYDSLIQLVGSTPLLSLRRYGQQVQAGARILAKLESFNPSGSAKDRAALFMIDDAERRGLLRPGATIIEPTSGNTGIALSWIAQVRGYSAIIVMPDSMSRERRDLMRAYGAQLVLTPGAQGMKGAIERAKQLAQEIPGSFVPGQFDNPANPDAHRRTTGPEIWQDTDGQLDAFVAGVGTGGTISGAGGHLKEMNPDIQIIAVEPADSPVLSGGAAGPHKLQGIGAGFIPGALDTQVYDSIVQVQTDQALEACRLLVATEGLLCGISSGAALHAATELAKQPEYLGKTIVVLLPDTGERYLSTPGFVSDSK